MKKYFDLLGFKVRDVVTGFTGIFTCVSFDLYGCVQALVNPGLDKDGKNQESRWYDLKRLERLSDGPVMAVPNFEVVLGGQDLPRFSSQPLV